MTIVFCQSLQHHLPDYPSWIGFLTHQGVPYPEIGGVLADTTIFVSVVLLLTGWYPKLLVLLLTIFILFASGFGHQFWNLTGDARAAQYANFTKNFSLRRPRLLLGCGTGAPGFAPTVVIARAGGSGDLNRDAKVNLSRLRPIRP